MLTNLYYIPVVPKLISHWNYLRSFKIYWYLCPIPSNCDLIHLKYGLIEFLKDPQVILMYRKVIEPLPYLTNWTYGKLLVDSLHPYLCDSKAYVLISADTYVRVCPLPPTIPPTTLEDSILECVLCARHHSKQLWPKKKKFLLLDHTF